MSIHGWFALASLSLALSAAACQRGESATSRDVVGTEASGSAPMSGTVEQLPPRCGKTARKLVAEGATLLDVREPHEFAEGHVEGAQSIPVGQVAGRLADIPKDRPVVTYCRSGGRAKRAAAVLEQAGYSVYQLGGIAEWDSTDC